MEMVQPHNTNTEELEYYQNQFKVASFKIDLYLLIHRKSIIDYKIKWFVWIYNSFTYIK